MELSSIFENLFIRFVQAEAGEVFKDDVVVVVGVAGVLIAGPFDAFGLFEGFGFLLIHGA